MRNFIVFGAIGILLFLNFTKVPEPENKTRKLFSEQYVREVLLEM